MAIGSVSNIWMNGRPSGLPENIEDQLAEAKREQVVTPIEEDISETESLRDTYKGFHSNLGEFLMAAMPLSDTSTFDVFSAASSDTQVAEVTAEAGAARGRYALDVTQQAQAHTLKVDLATGIADADATDLFSQDGQLSFFHGGSEYSYAITAGETSLNDLAQAIQAEDNGVTASVNNIGSPESPDYALILKSESTGAGQNLITSDGVNEGVALTAGGTDLFTGDWEQATSLPGQNAIFSVDGVEYERSSNTIEDVVDGLSLELTGGGVAEIAVQRDKDSVVQSIQKFVNAFNATQGYIDDKTSYDTENDKAGALLGSSLANNVQSRMRQIVLGAVPGTGSGELQYLSEIGVEFQRDGSLELNTAKLEAVLVASPDEVEALFAGENGVAERMSETLKNYTNSTDGSVTYKVQSLEQRIDRYEDDLDEAEADVQNYLERLVEKYTSMENAIRQYQSMQEQIESMNETFKAMYKD